jgi:hypothetical protein
VDGALDGDMAWSIKLHLGGCAVCSRVEQELRGTANLLSALPGTTPSANFEAKLAARLADQVLQPRRPTVIDRLRDWWYDAPYARPAALTSGAAALAAMIPLAIVGLHSEGASSQNPSVRNIVSRPTAIGASTTTLEQVWAEHASSDPFGDDSSLLLASAPTPSDGQGTAATPATTQANGADDGSEQVL